MKRNIVLSIGNSLNDHVLIAFYQNTEEEVNTKRLCLKKEALKEFKKSLKNMEYEVYDEKNCLKLLHDVKHIFLKNDCYLSDEKDFKKIGPSIKTYPSSLVDHISEVGYKITFEIEQR